MDNKLYLLIQPTFVCMDIIVRLCLRCVACTTIRGPCSVVNKIIMIVTCTLCFPSSALHFLRIKGFFYFPLHEF